MFWRNHNPLKHELANARQVMEATLRANVKANERAAQAAVKAGESGDKLLETVDMVLARHRRSEANA